MSDTAPRRHPDIRWKRTGKTGILLNIDNGDYFELDERGMAIWTRLDGRTPLATVSAKLAKSYGAKPADVARDVTSFVALLKRRRLVVDQPRAKSSKPRP